MYIKKADFRAKLTELIKTLKIFAKKFGGKEKMPTFAITNEKKSFETTNS